MVGVAPNEGSRRRLPVWMLGVAATDQERKSDDVDKNNHHADEGLLAQACHSEAKNMTKAPGKGILVQEKGVNSHFLLKCVTKKRRKASLQDSNLDGIITETVTKKKKDNRLGRKVREPTARKRQKAKGSDFGRGEDFDIQLPNDDDVELTMDDLMTIAEEYVKAEKNKEQQVSNRECRSVQTRVPQFGSTQSLLYLDPYLKHITAYMAPLVESLEQIGYVNGKTLFGAPYDFRYGLAAEGHPSQVGSKFLQDLKDLIEKASTSNGGKPVILLSHSLGGLFALQLLNRNPSSWRQKYIKHFIALSAPWGGTVEEMLTFASGNSLEVPLVEPLQVREEQRSSESNLWLMPNPKLFGSQKPLVITPNATYSANDVAQFLSDIGFPQGVYPYKSRISPLTEKLVAPGVPVTCITGSGVSTPETLFYGENGFDEQPEILYGDGDGTVNMQSLLALESLWSNEKNQTLKVIKIPGVSHTLILKNDAALEEIIGEISGINSIAEYYVGYRIK